MKTKIFFALTMLFTLQLAAQNDSMQYHDNVFESQWGSSTANDNFRYAVRFTPANYPATLVGIRAWFRNAQAGSTFKWVVYSDPNSLVNGGTNQLYISTNAIANPSAGGVTDSAYMAYIDLSAFNLTINAGDFYAGVSSTSGWQGLAIDNQPATNAYDNRQWTYTYIFSSGNWQTLASQASSGQWGITAFFAPSTTTGISSGNSQSPEIAPNPAADHFTLKNVSRNTQLFLYDATGNLVLSETIETENAEIDTRDISAGIYFLILRDDKQTFTGRLVRQ